MLTKENNSEQIKKLSQVDITPFLADLLFAFANIKKNEMVESTYIKANDKLEIYVFYKKEDFETEDKIIKEFTNWEEDYHYFPEIFVYPLDMIESKQSVLPEDAQEI